MSYECGRSGTRYYQCNECGWRGTKLVRGTGGYASCPGCDETLGDGFLHETGPPMTASEKLAEKERKKAQAVKDAEERAQKAKERVEYQKVYKKIKQFVGVNRLTSTTSPPVKRDSEGGVLLAGIAKKGMTRAIWFSEHDCLWWYKAEQDDYSDVWLWRAYVPVTSDEVATKRAKQLANPISHIIELIIGKLPREKFESGNWIMAYKLAVLELYDDASTHEGILETARSALLQSKLTATERNNPSLVRLDGGSWKWSSQRKRAEMLGIEDEAEAAWTTRKTEAEGITAKKQAVKDAAGRVKRVEGVADAASEELVELLGKKVTSRNVDTIGGKLESLFARYERYTTELVAIHELLGHSAVEGSVLEDRLDEVASKLAEIKAYAASLVACSVCGKRMRKNSLRAHEKKCVTKQAEEEQAEKERAEREAVYQADREARNARFREEREHKKAEREAKEAKEAAGKEEDIEVALSDASPKIVKAISKLRRVPKHTASEKQVGFTCSRFAEVFGRPMQTELVEKIEVGSKKSVSGIIDLINATSIEMTLQHGRRNGTPSEKQVSYAKRLVAQVYATDWESSRLGKAGVPYPTTEIIGKLGRAEVSAVIDQLKYLATRNSGW